MSPPHKRFNYKSPYGQNVSRYPSQTSEYMTQQHGGFCESRQNTPSTSPMTNNRPHFYQNRSQQNNGRHYGQRQQCGGHPHRFHEKDAFSQYFHETMLDDPWRDLITRKQAINDSVVRNGEDDDVDDAIVLT